MVLELVPIILLTIVLLIASISDLRFRRIPNLLTIPAGIVGVAYYSFVNGWNGFIFSMGGIFIGLALLMFFYLAGGMGAGDVKLMGAVGSMLGPKGVFAAFLFAAPIGGIYAIFLLALSGRLTDKFKKYKTILMTIAYTNSIAYVPTENKENEPVLCYGVVIALGTLLSVLVLNNFV